MPKPHEAGILPARHRTVSVYDVHQINHDRRPAFHAARQEIVALEPLDRVPYYVDTGEIESVLADTGCSAENLRRFNARLHVVDLVLEVPLDIGQYATLEYTTWFHYKAVPPPHYRRRISSSGMNLFDVSVRFDEDAIPNRVWYAEWEDIAPDSPIIPGSKIPMELAPLPPEAELEGIMQAHYTQVSVPGDTVRGMY